MTVNPSDFARVVRWSQVLKDLETLRTSLEKAAVDELNFSPELNTLDRCVALLKQIEEKCWEVATQVYRREEDKWLRQMKRTPRKSQRKNSARRKRKSS